jgi:hypothetical protein
MGSVAVAAFPQRQQVSFVVMVKLTGYGVAGRFFHGLVRPQSRVRGELRQLSSFPAPDAC